MPNPRRHGRRYVHASGTAQASSRARLPTRTRLEKMACEAFLTEPRGFQVAWGPRKNLLLYLWRGLIATFMVPSHVKTSQSPCLYANWNNASRHAVTAWFGNMSSATHPSMLSPKKRCPYIWFKASRRHTARVCEGLSRRRCGCTGRCQRDGHPLSPRPLRRRIEGPLPSKIRRDDIGVCGHTLQDLLPQKLGGSFQVPAPVTSRQRVGLENGLGHLELFFSTGHAKKLRRVVFPHVALKKMVTFKHDANSVFSFFAVTKPLTWLLGSWFRHLRHRCQRSPDQSPTLGP